MPRLFLATCIACGSIWVPSAALSQPPATGPAPATAPSNVVVAKVSGEPITAAEVDRTLAAALRGRQAASDALVLLRAEALAQIIDRRLLVDYLQKNKLGGSPQQVEAAVQKMKADLQKRKMTLADSLAKDGLTEAELRKQLAWQLGWDEYLQKTITDAQVEAYFKAHHRQFDGTQVRVSHILLKSDGAATPAAVAELVEKAKKLRQQIESGAVSFADAALKESAGPSRHQAGDLGIIPRQGLMVESFSAAAFALEKGEISQPVVTPYGVHLIQCTDIKPGDLPWKQSLEPLRRAVAQELFDKLASEQRATAKIEFTGAMPYFKLGTHDLVTK